MTRRPRRIIGATAAVVALVLAGCSDEDEPNADQTTTPAEPVVTAPPTTTPEDQAEAEIEATFQATIQALDDFYANASDYAEGAAGDPGWNLSLVEDQLRMLDQAQVDFLNSTNAFLGSKIEQVGRAGADVIGVYEVQFTDDGFGSATSEACLDMTGISFKTYAGEPAELPSEPAQYQTWAVTWRYVPDRQGWYLTHINVGLDQKC